MIVVLALLLLGPPAADRPEAERLFQLGIELVAEGDTAGAVAAWDGAEATGWTSAALAYNRGTVALAQGDLGAARLALERAARLDARTPEITSALAEVRDRAGDAPSPVEPVVRMMRATVGPVGLVLGTLVLYALALALGVAAVRRRTRPLVLGAGVSAALALCAVGLAVLVLRDASPSRAVALSDGVVRDAPSPTAPESGPLRAGASVELGDARGDWQAVQVGDVGGWVPRGRVAPLVARDEHRFRP